MGAAAAARAAAAAGKADRAVADWPEAGQVAAPAGLRSLGIRRIVKYWIELGGFAAECPAPNRVRTQSGKFGASSDTVQGSEHVIYH